MQVIAGKAPQGKMSLRDRVLIFSDRSPLYLRDVEHLEVVSEDVVKETGAWHFTGRSSKLGYITFPISEATKTLEHRFVLSTNDGRQILCSGSTKELRDLQTQLFATHNSAPPSDGKRGRVPSWTLALIPVFVLFMMSGSINDNRRIDGCYNVEVSAGEKPGAGSKWDEWNPFPDIVVSGEKGSQLAYCENSYQCNFQLINPRRVERLKIEDKDLVFSELIGEGSCEMDKRSCFLEPAATLTIRTCSALPPGA